MAFGSVTLTPGVNVERTPTLLRAGISQSSLIRFRDSLVQKYGGWQKFYPLALSGVPRDLHVWGDLNDIEHLSVGTTTQLTVITNGVAQNITPQIFLSQFPPAANFSTTINSNLVDITDPNLTAPLTVNDSVFFNVPVSIAGIILDGLYPINEITGVDSFQIVAPIAANATTTTSAIPVFTTTLGDQVVSVNIPNHGLTIGTDEINFAIPTTGNGVTIQNAYSVILVTDANNFSINVNAQATASGSFPMNGGDVELLYFIAQGPPALGSGYGLGGYGEGGYGTGAGTPGNQPGTPISATDWTTDNWGEILIANPKGGPIYYWDPTGGFLNAQIISSGPIYNNGIFISMAQQILIAYGSSVHLGIGYQQQPLLVQWTDVGNFLDWTPSAVNQAGNFVIPNGTEIIAGAAVSNQDLLWTDLDLWAMNYIGFPDVFGFNKIGAGMGAVSSHAVQQFRGSVYWMNPTNFCNYTSNGAAVIPCPVWDVVFQNLNTEFQKNIRSMPNTPYNEVGWLYPSLASTSGECDSYVKMNVTEPSQPWDYGPLNRSAWNDQSILGMPIGASPSGIIYQHETTPDADGQPLMASFTTGYFYLSEGEEFVSIDEIWPDFRWSTFPYTGSSAQIQMSFNVLTSADGAPITYGPYTVTQATQFISVRFRGRMMSITVASNDIGSWWRLGSCKYRYTPAGRR